MKNARCGLCARDVDAEHGEDVVVLFSLLFHRGCLERRAPTPAAPWPTAVDDIRYLRAS